MRMMMRMVMAPGRTRVLGPEHAREGNVHSRPVRLSCHQARVQEGVADRLVMSGGRGPDKLRVHGRTRHQGLGNGLSDALGVLGGCRGDRLEDGGRVPPVGLGHQGSTRVSTVCSFRGPAAAKTKLVGTVCSFQGLGSNA